MAIGGASGSLRAEVFRTRRARAHWLWLTALVFACGGEASRDGTSSHESESGGRSGGTTASGVNGGEVAATGGAVGAGSGADTASGGADVAGAAGALGTCPSYKIDDASCGFARLDLRQHPLTGCTFVPDPQPAGSHRNSLLLDCELQSPSGNTGGWHWKPEVTGACGDFDLSTPGWSPGDPIEVVLDGEVCDKALRAERIDMFYQCPCLL